jgi:hypothetical protein
MSNDYIGTSPVPRTSRVIYYGKYSIILEFL